LFQGITMVGSELFGRLAQLAKLVSALALTTAFTWNLRCE